MSSENDIEVFNNEPLNHELSNHNDKEPDVIEELTHNVVFCPSDLSASNLIEQVHHDKSMEENCVVLKHILRIGIAKIVKVCVDIVVPNTEPIRNTV